MAFSGKVVLFVEGQFTPRHRGSDPLDLIWREQLPEALNLVEIERIVPISKKDIVAMGPEATVSGAGLMPLSERMRVELQADEFDAAVVAWDLQPPWDPQADVCSWEETLRLHRGLADGDALPPPWREQARVRYEELKSRTEPSWRLRPCPLQRYSVLPVCMVPTFESILLCCERGIREALGVKKKSCPGWPRWDERHHSPDALLQLAIRAAKASSPRGQAFKRIRGDMITAKNDWDEYFLRHLINDQECLTELRSHSTALRLRELLRA